MAASFGKQDSIMNTTNVIASSVKEMLAVLKQLPNNEHALGLTTAMFQQVTILGTTARSAVSYLGDKMLFDNLLSIVDVIISIIDQHVPYIY